MTAVLVYVWTVSVIASAVLLIGCLTVTPFLIRKLVGGWD